MGPQGLARAGAKGAALAAGGTRALEGTMSAERAAAAVKRGEEAANLANGVLMRGVANTPMAIYQGGIAGHMLQTSHDIGTKTAFDPDSGTYKQISGGQQLALGGVLFIDAVQS